MRQFVCSSSHPAHYPDKGLGALDDDESEHTETVSQNIRDALANPNDADMRSLAFGIWYGQFDHPYDGAYCEAIGELAPESKKILAGNGSAVAQLSLGVMNYPIDSMSAVTKTPDAGATGDLQEAMSWYRRAAEQGHFDALVTLGIAYWDGIGVSQDYVEAYKFFNVAAPRAKYDDLRLETIKRRDEVAAKMTKAQLAEAQKLSREWKPTK